MIKKDSNDVSFRQKQQMQQTVKSKKAKNYKRFITMFLISVLILILILSFNCVVQKRFKKKYMNKFQSSQKGKICIISSTPAFSFQEIVFHFDHINKDKYKNWNAIYFLERRQQINTSFIQKHKGKIIVLYTHGIIQKNIYDAIHHHCHIENIVMLFNYHQRTILTNMLQMVAKQFKNNRQCFGFGVTVQFPQKIIKPNKKLLTFIRRDFYQQAPIDYFLLQSAEESVRFFRALLFSFIGHWYLQNDKGEFFNTSLSFILPILELGRGSFSQKISNNFFIQTPTTILINQHLKIFSNKKKIITQKQQIKLIVNFLVWRNFQFLMSVINYHNISITKKINTQKISLIGQFRPIYKKLNQLPVINDYWSQDVTQKTIPKKIHQIWFQGQIPNYKKYFMQKNKNLHAQFEYKVWSKDNVTKQNFPNTYDIIQALLIADKTSIYSRLASIADLMRYQIIYRQGGFYVDTNYLLFASLDKYLNYSFFIAGFEPPLDYVATSNSIFGAKKRHPVFERLIDKKQLSKIDLFGAANKITGPYYFAAHISREDILSSQSKIIPCDMIFPYYYWYPDKKLQINYCSYPLNQTIPQQILQYHPIEIIAKQYKILANCSFLYPNAIGIDFYDLGGSWTIPRKNKYV